MSTRHGRFKFLRDAERMGLNARTAFSQVELRRQRDRLMIADRGGSQEMAAQINDTYTRMRKWLLESKAQSQRLASEAATVAETRDPGEFFLSARRWLESRQMSLAAIILGAGYTMLKNRRQ